MTCAHEAVEQFSTIEAMTLWLRQDNGRYEPAQVPLTKVLEEQTTAVRCLECGEAVEI